MGRWICGVSGMLLARSPNASSLIHFLQMYPRRNVRAQPHHARTGRYSSANPDLPTVWNSRRVDVAWMEATPWSGRVSTGPSSADDWTALQDVRLILHAAVDYLANDMPKLPRLNNETSDLLIGLLTLDPSRRLTADQALDHVYFWKDPLPAPLGR